VLKMETCIRCKERWFLMDLKNEICHTCFLRDKGNKTPFLMSADNEMDPGEIPAHLPELTQVEEMIIARSHVQMMLHRYRGHQYFYSGHCVSFMQNNVKTVDMLPNLPSELDIVVLRPSNLTPPLELAHRIQIGFQAPEDSSSSFLDLFPTYAAPTTLNSFSQRLMTIGSLAPSTMMTTSKS
jgi:hypothetical protein